MKLDGASRWLRENVDAKFWEMTEEMWNDQNWKYREEIMACNAALGLQSKESGMKHLSYWGAVEIEEWAMKWSAKGFPGYADVGNYFYADVFRSIWSESHICEYSDKTIGDRVEALLGWFIYWTMRQRQRRVTREGAHFSSRVFRVDLMYQI